MQPANRYYNRAKISEPKFRYVLRLVALDLTASDTAPLDGLERAGRQRLVPAPAPLAAGLKPGAGLTEFAS